MSVVSKPLPDPVLVTGFLGAGKSLLAARLRQALPGREIVEASGGALPPPERAAGPVVAVADAVNLVECLEDPLLGPLVSAQIRTGGLVVLSRTDLIPAAPALEALAGITDAEVVELSLGDLPAGLAVRIAELPSRAAGPGLPAEAVPFAEWRYRGPAELTPSAAEALIARRPAGVYRLSGVVRCGGGGLEMEAAGRIRQTRAIPAPPETTLLAIGPRARFRTGDMALRFSEAVAARGWLSGLFSYR